MIYCCIHGCKCPCESCCTCCDKENDPQLQYEVKNGSLAAGIGNDAFVNENDNASHNGSQRPLYEKHLPEDKFTKNPAVWYENNFTKELHRTQNVSLISDSLYFSSQSQVQSGWSQGSKVNGRKRTVAPKLTILGQARRSFVGGPGRSSTVIGLKNRPL